MSNPVCISPLKFYDSPAKQNHRKSYAHGHISPLITKIGWIPPFQFVIPASLYNVALSTNLYNKDAAGCITGKYVNYSTGNLSNSTNAKASDYIPVTAGKSYVSNNLGQMAFYNANKEYISGYADFNSVRVAPENAAYMRVSIYSYATADATAQVNEGIVLLPLVSVYLYNAKTDELIGNNRINQLNTSGFSIININDNYICLFTSINKAITDISEGLYYLKITAPYDIWAYYSEVFCFTNVTQDCLELEYWNETGNFAIKNGIIAFPNNFHFKLLLKTEIGKPEYNFEEESTKRLGYIFVESQVSKKTYKFNAVVPEYICDALRLVRLCDNKIIRCKDDEYEAITFEMEAEWQTQGDLASVTCEFETDNIVANIGGFVPDKLGGDYNNDYNEDFDKE